MGTFGDQVLNDSNYQELSEGIAENSQAISSIGAGGPSTSACKSNSAAIQANSAHITTHHQEISSVFIDLSQLSLAHSQTHSELQVVSGAVSTNVANITSVSQAALTCCSQAKSQAQMLYAAGATTQVQFNESGLLFATSDLLFDKTNVRLGIGIIPTVTFEAVGDAYIHGTLKQKGLIFVNQATNPLSGSPGLWTNTSSELTYFNGTADKLVSLAGHQHAESDITDLDHYTTSDFTTDFGNSNLANLGARNYADLTNKPSLTQLHDQNTDVALRTNLLVVDASGHTAITGELKIAVYRQGTMPTLSGKNFFALWVNTATADRTYLLFARNIGDQIAVELS